ncbi:hypothetical protein MBANPS3_012538 [Mucor bainieri]
MSPISFSAIHASNSSSIPASTDEPYHAQECLLAYSGLSIEAQPANVFAYNNLATQQIAMVFSKYSDPADTKMAERPAALPVVFDPELGIFVVPSTSNSLLPSAEAVDTKPLVSDEPSSSASVASADVVSSDADSSSDNLYPSVVPSESQKSSFKKKEEKVMEWAEKILYPDGTEVNGLTTPHEKVMAVLHTFFVTNPAGGMKSAAEAHGVYFINKCLANTQFAIFQKSAVELSRGEENTLNERLRVIALMEKQADNSIAKIKEKAATSAPKAHPLARKMMPTHSKFLAEYWGVNPFSSAPDVVRAFKEAFPDFTVADATITQHATKHCNLIIRRVGASTPVSRLTYYSTRTNVPGVVVHGAGVSEACVVFTSCNFYMYNRRSFGWVGRAAKSPERSLPETGGIFFTLLVAFNKDGVLATAVETAVSDCSDVKFLFLTQVVDMVKPEGKNALLCALDEAFVMDKAKMRTLEDKGCSLSYIIRLDPCLINFWVVFRQEIPRSEPTFKKTFTQALRVAALNVKASVCQVLLGEFTKRFFIEEA